MADLTTEQKQTLTRWRLVLGKSAERHGICLCKDDEEARRIEALVGFLFAPNGGSGGPGTQPKERTGGSGPGHTMNVPRWVDEVGQLFPRQAREVMERELINRKGLR